MKFVQHYVFVFCYDSGSAESGPKLSEGCSQEIKATSPEEAWKKLQKNLKMQRKLYKKYKKQLRRDRSKINLPHWSWMSAIMHGPDRDKYSKDYIQVLDVESWGAPEYMDCSPAEYTAQGNYELYHFYKRGF